MTSLVMVICYAIYLLFNISITNQVVKLQYGDQFSTSYHTSLGEYGWQLSQERKFWSNTYAINLKYQGEFDI